MTQKAARCLSEVQSALVRLGGEEFVTTSDVQLILFYAGNHTEGKEHFSRNQVSYVLTELAKVDPVLAAKFIDR